LDLLAIDKQGCLVLIENKLDDTRSRCYLAGLEICILLLRLSKEDILTIFQAYLIKIGANETKAKSAIVEFLGAAAYDEVVLNQGSTQRIILVAANFRKEVTSTVLWLLTFKMRIQCIKVTPWLAGAEPFLAVDQIIPAKDVRRIHDRARLEVLRMRSKLTRTRKIVKSTQKFLD